jgi:hypothetical protein
MKRLALLLIIAASVAQPLAAQNTTLPPIEKVKNFLPHMTRPDVESLLTRSDMVIIPVASLEQHGTHLPIGTDYLNGVERAKLVAQRVEIVGALELPLGFDWELGGQRQEMEPSFDSVRLAIVLAVCAGALRRVPGQMLPISLLGLLLGAAFYLVINLSLALASNLAALSSKAA